MQQDIPFYVLILFFLLIPTSLVSPLYDGPLYDFTAYTECKEKPEEPLYGGGILKSDQQSPPAVQDNIVSSYVVNNIYVPSLVLHNLTQDTIYTFSAWVRVKGSSSAMIRATLETEKETYDCIGTVSAKLGCWSFLKGGFVLNWPSNLSIIFFQNADGKDINIEVASPSLQPFTKQQWETNQQYTINTKRKRAVTIHVSDSNGRRLQGASICIEQISKEFLFGSAIAHTILGNVPYQNWFVKRFNAAVFEKELKWYATEPDEGKVNYTISDQMLQFVRTKNIVARGHNIFWEDPKYNPPWVLNLTGTQLQSAVNSRIKSLMSQYRNEFIHWDVSNEMLHFDFYEQRLGSDATLHFFETAHESDPLSTLFMKDFNVVETCSDVNSTVDAYISRVKELRRNGILMDGIGLEGHFTIPNPPLIRAILDKLATLGLPIWLTEVDISKTIDTDSQGNNLEQVLREGFSHPAVNGIMLWTAYHPNGCYQMCLTDKNFKNLAAGDVVDKLLQEWKTGRVEGVTDVHGSYSFYGFLGEYTVTVNYGNRTTKSTFSLSRGQETEHFTITLSSNS
ncbi:endo-1,4-beta-xylanase 5 [Vigna umbellata]|uniref:endo-1,4-beta-xylanase 5 n=1 Tax=Vigna umbellata TaxID=87088 RepID=UPI001F5E66C6|nr:endo-1,4-beta-xylanase 5 [Vigna umbellata]